MNLFDKVKSTMKCQDIEGWFELHFTRTPGYLWALVFRALHVHPIAVTLASIVIGASSGLFFVQEGFMPNLIGVLLVILANMFDCADGQLARMTGKCTTLGRILDGFASDLIFLSIYVSIAIKYTPEWGIWIWVAGSIAGFYCHRTQCCISDYYRNIHMWMVMGPGFGELERSENLGKQYKSLRFDTKNWFEKLYLYFYQKYTREQENFTPKFQQLYKTLAERYPDGNIPQEIRDKFRKGSLPLMPWGNVLTYDTRAAVLYITALLGITWGYYIFEIVVLEPLKWWVLRRHERLCETLL